MTTTTQTTQQGAPRSQLPGNGAIFLDHVGHFVEDPASAASALRAAGFAPTPASIQTNPQSEGGPPRLTGTGNVCAMLPEGYLEVLFKTAETPLAAEFDVARARYRGLHLVAFATADAAVTHDRLAASGFVMQPLVRMQRPVATASGEGTAAFEVVRLAPGQMPEGRVQMLRHLTEETVWQPRWITHPNGARRLASLTIVVADVDEASQRFSRFTGRPASADEMGRSIRLDRGRLILASIQTWQQRWPQQQVPVLPYMGECGIEVADLEMTARILHSNGQALIRRSNLELSVRFPDALGHGIWTFSNSPP